MYGTFGRVVRSAVTEWMIIGAVVVALVFGGTLFVYEVAQAGSNGQVLRVGNACPNPATLKWVKITGRNQNNKHTVWQSSPNTSVVQTNGYLWVGMVRIEWKTDRSNAKYMTSAVVPKNYSRDWFGVLLDKWGCD